MPVILLLCMIQSNSMALGTKLPNQFYRDLYSRHAAMKDRDWREVNFHLNLLQSREERGALPFGVDTYVLGECLSNADTNTGDR